MATVKDYGAGPAFKVLPPDPPASAVWVGAGQPPLDPEKTQVLRVGQRGFQFRPGLLVLQTGTPVTFPNEDPLYHSVFSYSPIKRLDLGRYRQGEEPPPVVMDKPGMIPQQTAIPAFWTERMVRSRSSKEWVVTIFR